MKIFNKLIGSATNITKKFKSEPQIIQICQRIYHCPFPSNPHIFTQMLKNLTPQQVQIWNLSQYKYTKNIYEELQQLGFNINQVSYQFYSSMPLTTTITSMNKIQRFLKSSQHNYIFVHCQENKSRSILFLAAYMFLSGKISDVATALAFINQKLGNNSNQTVYSSQHLILRNIANFHRDPTFINKQQLKLLKIIINQAPKLPSSIIKDESQVKILLQIRKNANVIYKKLLKHVGEGQIFQFKFKEQSIILSDDCLFSFKYVYNEKIYPVMRIQMNTNFVFNCFLRVQMQQIDLSKNVEVKGHVFGDFLFSSVQDTYSQLSNLSHKGAITQIKRTENKTESRSPGHSSKIQKIMSNLPKKGEENDKDAFSLHDEDKEKEELDQQTTQQKISKLLDSMAKNQAQAEQDLQLHKQQVKQEPKVQDILVKQKQAQQISSPATKNKPQQVRIQSGDEDDDQLDIDDYLNKLEEQADQK